MVEIAQKFGKYTLLERLAVGGMAEIFKARVAGVDGFEKIVAIKRLHRQYSEDQKLATMLVDEAKLAVRLNHPNIGEVFDLGCIDGQYFIVMEYIEGLDLRQLADWMDENGGQVPPQLLAHVAALVADALHHAHTRRDRQGEPLQLVHRDVSPQNIMISVDGAVKLVDFGIAKARHRAQNTQAGIIKGKFYYMSPEQAHDSTLDGRTDIYALAMVLYELLVGSHPFEGIRDHDLMMAVRKADYPPIGQVRPDLPDRLIEIIDRALQRDRRHRFDDALQMKRALQSYVESSSQRFDRMKLAEIVRRYTSDEAPGDDIGCEPMASGQYRASQYSVIYETDVGEEQKTDELDQGGEFEQEPTQIFMRDDESGAEPSAPGRTATPTPTPAVPMDRTGGGAGPTPVHRDETTSPGHRDEPQPAERLQQWVWAQLETVNPVVVAVAAVVVVALGGLLVMGVMGGEVDDEPGDVDDAMVGQFDDDESVTVTSIPSEATVIVDGTPIGETPVTLETEPGEMPQEVVLELDGYRPERLEWSEGGQTGWRAVRLEPEIDAVAVVSDPPGAAIYVEDRLRGTTPMVLEGLTVGENYDIEARDDEDQTESVTLRWPGDGERVEFEFDEVEEEKSQPRRAPSPPRRRAAQPASSGSPAGAGGQAQQDSSDDDGDEGLDIWQLGGDEQGRLNVRSRDDGGRVYVNGDMVHDDPVLVGHRLEAGTYDVRVYFETTGEYSETRTVEVEPGSTTTVRFSP